MTALTNLENAISVGEEDVIAFFSKAYSDFKQVETTVAADLKAAATEFLNILQWIEAHGTQISQIAMTAISTAVGLGVGVPPGVIAASTLLAQGVSAVQEAIASAQASAAAGKSVEAQAVAAASTAYQTFNNAKNAMVAAPKAS